MNTFQLKVVNPEAGDLANFFNISEDRMAALQERTNEAFNAQKGSDRICTGTVLSQVVPACETLEEVTMLSYAIGNMFERKQSRNSLSAFLAAMVD